MVRFFRHHIFAVSRKKLAALLALSWFSGIAFGLYFSLSADPMFVSQMRTAVDPSVSIVRLLAVLFLPLLFSAFAVYVSHLWLLIPCCFLKALSFSYIGGIFFRFSESGGWLVRYLYLFSDCFAVPALCWLWLRCCRCGRRDALISCAVTGLLILTVCVIDDRFISPFLCNLLS